MCTSYNIDHIYHGSFIIKELHTQGEGENWSVLYTNLNMFLVKNKTSHLEAQLNGRVVIWPSLIIGLEYI